MRHKGRTKERTMVFGSPPHLHNLCKNQTFWKGRWNAGLWQTDTSKWKAFVFGSQMFCFAACLATLTGLYLVWVAGQEVCYYLSIIFRMALIYLPFLWSCSRVPCPFYSVPALSQRPGLLQIALVPINIVILIWSSIGT